MENKITKHNTGLAKVAVQCFADTFVVSQSLVLRINICGENRHLRQARNRYDDSANSNRQCKKQMTKIQLLTRLKQQTQLLPLLLLTAYCIDAVITAVRRTVVMAGVTYDYELTIKHYIAFGAIGINFLTYFFLRPFYKYTLGLTVAVGLFNIMTFSALKTTSSFGINSLQIAFQPSAFWAGLLAYIINFK